MGIYQISNVLFAVFRWELQITCSIKASSRRTSSFCPSIVCNVLKSETLWHWIDVIWRRSKWLLLSPVKVSSILSNDLSSHTSYQFICNKLKIKMLKGTRTLPWIRRVGLWRCLKPFGMKCIWLERCLKQMIHTHASKLHGFPFVLQANIIGHYVE